MSFTFQKIHITDFINSISSEIDNLQIPEDDDSKLNRYILLSEFEKKNIVETLRFMLQSSNMICDANNLVKDIILASNRGKIYEALTYSYLRELNIPFVTHFEVQGNSCLKKSGKYFSDGKFTFGFPDKNDDESSSVLFEIKSFGIGEPMIEKLKKQISNYYPNYLILVEGDLNVSTLKIQKCALEKIKDICSKLNANSHANGELYYKIPDIDISIRAVPHEKFIKDRIVIGDVSYFQPYKWAMNNEYYFIKHCSQVCKNRPYLIICPFDECVTHTFTGGFTETINTAFRSLARRMFIGMDKCNKRLNEFDGKASEDILVSDAIKYVSGIMFLNVNKIHNGNEKSVWIYTNPNAINPIPKYQIEQLANFNYYGVVFDDFLFDNY